MNSTSKPSIVFLGSGPVAAESLRLIQSHCQVEAVITKPTTLFQMQNSLQAKISVFTATNKASLDELIERENFKSSLAVLIDFGIIVSGKVIKSFPKGIINSHFSLLPQWRGADPISFSILSGQNETGISLMIIDEGMDTGELIHQTKYKITNKLTTPELTEDLIKLSDQSIKNIIPGYIEGKVAPFPQEESKLATSIEPSYSRKLSKVDGILNFNKSAQQLEREVRAFAGWPKSRTTIAGKDVVVTLASSSEQSDKSEIGKIYKTDDKKIAIECRMGDLIIEKLKPAGKKEMTSEAFLAGNKIQ